MKEISLNILDIAQNSVRANATEIKINVFFDTAADKLTVSVSDDGCGMSGELLAKVLDPFTTTRTTRRVGLGLPLFRQSALDAGGDFHIESRRRGDGGCRLLQGKSHLTVCLWEIWREP